MFGIEPLTPAYGRVYTSLKAAQYDFDLDKDFKTSMGQYINKPQLTVDKVRVRYGKRLEKTGFLECKKKT